MAKLPRCRPIAHGRIRSVCSLTATITDGWGIAGQRPRQRCKDSSSRIATPTSRGSTWSPAAATCSTTSPRSAATTPSTTTTTSRTPAIGTSHRRGGAFATRESIRTTSPSTTRTTWAWSSMPPGALPASTIRRPTTISTRARVCSARIPNGGVWTATGGRPRGCPTAIQVSAPSPFPCFARWRKSRSMACACSTTAVRRSRSTSRTSWKRSRPRPAKIPTSWTSTTRTGCGSGRA